MKVAVSAAGRTLDDRVDGRFGRCPWFLIVDTETMEVDALENHSIGLGGGAGVQSAQVIIESGAEAVLTGNCGPNAFQVLRAGGVDVYSRVEGRIRDAVEAFSAGTLSLSPRANVRSHHGMTQDGEAEKQRSGEPDRG